MLGSLVVVYPTSHQGGELVLHHKNREWMFDANDLTSSQSSPSLAYIAFYSDIEHEVLKVTSGQRVTLTYNLYLFDPMSRPKTSTLTPNLKNVSNLQTTLQGLLKSPDFLPNGGTLGFGLAHLYPVTFETKLQEMAGYLKGEDAHVYQACLELQLQPSLRVIYDDDQSGQGYGIMLEQITKDPSYDYTEDSYERALLRDPGGILVNKTEDTDPSESYWACSDDEPEIGGELITWISPFNEKNRLQDISMGYGNEVEAGYIYSSPCLIARIAAASDRV